MANSRGLSLVGFKLSGERFAQLHRFIHRPALFGALHPLAQERYRPQAQLVSNHLRISPDGELATTSHSF